MLKEAAAELPKLEEQLEESQKRSDELKTELNKSEDELTKLRGTLEGDLKPLRDTREKYEVELMSMQKEINEAKAALDLKSLTLISIFSLKDKKDQSLFHWNQI